MEKRTASIVRWLRLMGGVALTLVLLGWGLFAPSASESFDFTFDGATIESLGQNRLRMRHVGTNIPGIPFGQGVLEVNPDLSLRFVEGGSDTSPPSSGNNSSDSQFKVEGAITSIPSINAFTTDFIVHGEGVKPGGVLVQMTDSTIVVFEKAPPGISLGRKDLARGQFVKAKGNSLGLTDILATEVEVEEVKVKGPITEKVMGGTFTNGNGAAFSLACTLRVFPDGVKVLIPTAFATLCTLPVGTVVEAEGPFVDTDGNHIGDSILTGEGEEED